MDALKDGQSWLDSNPEADAEEIKDPPPAEKNTWGGGVVGSGMSDFLTICFLNQGGLVKKNKWFSTRTTGRCFGIYWMYIIACFAENISSCSIDTVALKYFMAACCTSLWIQLCTQPRHT